MSNRGVSFLITVDHLNLDLGQYTLSAQPCIPSSHHELNADIVDKPLATPYCVVQRGFKQHSKPLTVSSGGPDLNSGLDPHDAPGNKATPFSHSMD